MWIAIEIRFEQLHVPADQVERRADFMCEVRGCLTGRGESPELVHAPVRAPEFEISFLKLLISFLQFGRRFTHAVAQYFFFLQFHA